MKMVSLLNSAHTGLCQGEAFSTSIRERVRHSKALAKMLAYARTPGGSMLLDQVCLGIKAF